MSQAPHIYQVSQLSDEMRRLMELSYPEIWIEGELSSLSTPASGHLYFSLKDEKAQLRCAMFKSRANRVPYRPKVGDLVRIRAKISVYTARGDLQCIVQYIEDAGEGLLQRRFEQLKASLNKQGLFDHTQKQTLPAFPKNIGVITSPSGAAVRDIVSTLRRRCPSIPISIYSAVVQGEGSAASIIAAIENATQDQRCDVLILSRGGGSLEDLWSFNDEGLAFAIHRCPIPIVSGVGHEVDVTIADLCADLRAPTPTAAAELVSPDIEQLLNQLESIRFRLPNSIERIMQRRAQQVDISARQLIHPKQQLLQNREKIERLSARLRVSTRSALTKSILEKDNLLKRLFFQNPEKTIRQQHRSLDLSAQRLKRATIATITHTRKSSESIGNQLHMVSPLATLDRGFAIARDSDNNILRTVDDVSVNDKITLKLSEGELNCSVTNVDS